MGQKGNIQIFGGGNPLESNYVENRDRVGCYRNSENKVHETA